MATVEKIAKAALQRILVREDEAQLEASETDDFIFALNNYMLALDAEGINLGFTEVSSLADEVTVPTGALRGIIANMAIEIAPDFNGKVTEGLIVAASAGLRVMRILGQSMGATEYPSTLPMGSGNYDRYGSNYYSDLEDTILAETTGSISLETSTND